MLLHLLALKTHTRTYTPKTQNTSNNHHLFVKIYKKKHLCISCGTSRKSLIRRASSSFKHNASFVARLPTIRRHKSQSLHSPAGNSKPPSAPTRGRSIQRTMAEMNTSAENLGNLKNAIIVLTRKNQKKKSIWI